MAALNAFDRAMQVLGIGFAVAIGGGLVYVAYQEWSKKSDLAALEKQKSGIGTQASVTATLLLSAQKDCRIIGLDIHACATHSGPLLQDKTAPVLAQTALKAHASYTNACHVHYDAEYCKNLLTHTFTSPCYTPARAVRNNNGRSG